MPGQHITDEQRRKFMKLITEEKLAVQTAAAKSGFSRRTGFKIKKELKTGSPEEKKPRQSRRPDPQNPLASKESPWDHREDITLELLNKSLSKSSA